jgi:fumarylacetoacetase
VDYAGTKARQSVTSWIDIPADCDFSIYNIPFGVFKTTSVPPRCCTAIGNYVVDLVALADQGYFNSTGVSPLIFRQENLNAFIALGKKIQTRSGTG